MEKASIYFEAAAKYKITYTFVHSSKPFMKTLQCKLWNVCKVEYELFPRFVSTIQWQYEALQCDATEAMNSHTALCYKLEKVKLC